MPVWPINFKAARPGQAETPWYFNFPGYGDKRFRPQNTFPDPSLQALEGASWLTRPNRTTKGTLEFTGLKANESPLLLTRGDVLRQLVALPKDPLTLAIHINYCNKGNLQARLWQAQELPDRAKGRLIGAEWHCDQLFGFLQPAGLNEVCLPVRVPDINLATMGVYRLGSAFQPEVQAIRMSVSEPWLTVSELDLSSVVTCELPPEPVEIHCLHDWQLGNVGRPRQLPGAKNTAYQMNAAYFGYKDKQGTVWLVFVPASLLRTLDVYAIKFGSCLTGSIFSDRMPLFGSANTPVLRVRKLCVPELDLAPKPACAFDIDVAPCDRGLPGYGWIAEKRCLLEWPAGLQKKFRELRLAQRACLHVVGSRWADRLRICELLGVSNGAD